jgi:hypothetical protein
MKNDQPTQIQRLAVSLVFAAMGEGQINRTNEEYMAIAAKLPPLKRLLGMVNRLLELNQKCFKECGRPMPEICRFKAGDKLINFESYPREISYETLRAALVRSGMRDPKWTKAA